MKLLTYAKQRFFRSLVGLDKRSAFYALRSLYFDGMVRRLNTASLFSWDRFDSRRAPSKFEDLAGLFFCSPLNRGILRQDFDEAALLFKHVSRLDSPKGVEIGRFYGGSTVLLATAISSGGKLYSIDIAPKGGDKELSKVLLSLGFQQRVQLIVCDANKYELNERLDFAFIDGDHSYEGARLDHNKWGKLVKPGGLIIHHDMANARAHATQWNDLDELYKSILCQQKNCLQLVEAAGTMVVFMKPTELWIDLPARGDQETVNPEERQLKGNSYLDREAS